MPSLNILSNHITQWVGSSLARFHAITIEFFLLHHDMDNLNRKYFENQEDFVAWKVKKFFQESSCQNLWEIRSLLNCQLFDDTDHLIFSSQQSTSYNYPEYLTQCINSQLIRE